MALEPQQLWQGIKGQCAIRLVSAQVIAEASLKLVALGDASVVKDRQTAGNGTPILPQRNETAHLPGECDRPSRSTYGHRQLADRLAAGIE